MASEIQVRVTLAIRKGNQEYTSLPGAATLDMDGTKGPTPGALTIPTGGKVISLEEIVTPGVCWMINLDDTNYVEYGIRDPDSDRFYPLGELLPGIPTLIVLSRNLLEAYEGTGTGTSTTSNEFFMKAIGGDCEVKVNAFER